MKELTKENFEEVLKTNSIVLVDYWSPSCELCKELTGHIKDLEAIYSEEVKFTSLNITKARRLAIKQKVLSLPVVAIYKDGEKAESVVGDAATKEAVEELIKKHI